MRRSLIAAVAVASLAAPIALATAGSAAAAPVPPKAPVTDFNHDGYADLAISAPGGTAGATPGQVSVVYGSATGPDTAHAKTITRGTPGVPGTPENGDRFGNHTAAADLDGDGYTDLVVNGGDKSVVLWGSAQGLTGEGSTELASNGARVTAGDFNGDGKRDLVTAEYPEPEDPMDNDDQGMTISYGPFKRDGKPASSQQVVTSQTFGPGDFVVGDLTGDGADDIVTSHGFEEMAYKSQFWQGGKDGVATTSQKLAPSLGGAIADVGSSVLLKGSRAGLTGTGSQAFQQSTEGVPGAAEKGDKFGSQVLLSDTNKDGKADLTVTAPLEDGAYADSGAAWHLRGAAGGLTVTGVTSFGPAAIGANDKGVRFGDHLAR